MISCSVGQKVYMNLNKLNLLNCHNELFTWLRKLVLVFTLANVGTSLEFGKQVKSLVNQFQTEHSLQSRNRPYIVTKKGNW